MSSYRLRLTPSLSGRYQDGGLIDSITAGGDLPSLAATLTQGAGETWQQVLVPVSLTAGGNLDVDLADPANSLTDRAGRPLNLSVLYAAVLTVAAPDGVKKLRLGPQNLTNAAQLWFGGVGATAYETVDRYAIRVSQGGWAVTPGTGDLLRVNNPTGVTVAGSLFLVGKQ